MRIQAKNRDELDSMIKRTITLNDDETIKVTVISEPKKILFFNVKGIYEVEILKKMDTKEKKENKKQEEFIKKEKRNFEKNNNKKFENKKEFNKEKNQKIEKKEIKIIKENKDDENYAKIRSFVKEFIVKTKLDINIINIEKKSDRYVINLDGKDMRYLIGEKGSTLNSLEYLLSSVKMFKNIKINIDSNNYKDAREKSLRDLARKKGKRVLETKKSIKLNPMSARERKIIHEEISHMKGLKTESQGEEPKRFLVIKPE